MINTQTQQLVDDDDKQENVDFKFYFSWICYVSSFWKLILKMSIFSENPEQFQITLINTILSLHNKCVEMKDINVEPIS